MKRFILVTTVFLFAPATAHAHGGHVGELAGHSHWIGLGALLAAAALAALVAKLKKTDKANADDVESSGDDGELEGESA